MNEASGGAARRSRRGALLLCAAALGACCGAGAQAAQGAPSHSDWHDRLIWQGREAHVTVDLDGTYALHSPAGVRVISAQRWRAHTASPLFDALFAMAQQDLDEDSVAAIRDAAFDHGRPIPCRCFIAGKDWPFVWTRDVSYSIDLGLWRLHPGRARASLLFKISRPRAGATRPGLYVMQDTGSGGSWPVSTDRVVWFLAARHLLADPVFADTVYRTLTDTLAQDRRYVFDPRVGLYHGETSFLDWREQTYPAWTAHNVVFIAQSFALSTNALHYEALRLAADMARRRGLAAAALYARQAQDLAQAINTRFWRRDRGLYMSYIGGPVAPEPFDAYDLLGLDLVITSGIADPRRAISQSTYVPGNLGGPVVDSPRQLWSVAGYLDMVVRGVFGVESDGRIAPRLPAALVPMLFGRRRRISLYLDGRTIVLRRPAAGGGALLVAGPVRHRGDATEVQLVAASAHAAPPPMNAPLYLGPLPPAPRLREAADLGPAERLEGPWPRHWNAPRRGTYLAWLRYSNSHGPINTGITAAVKRLAVLCVTGPRQIVPIVMPQSEGWQASTTARFTADGGASCTFSLLQGFNMSDLVKFAQYTGPPPPAAGGSAAPVARAHPQQPANGWATGPLNSAQVGALWVAPLAAEGARP